MTAGRWWFLQHAQFNKHRFGLSESVMFAWKLSRLGYGGFVGTLLRIVRFEFRSALR